jgi:hypothetical protein
MTGGLWDDEDGDVDDFDGPGSDFQPVYRPPPTDEEFAHLLGRAGNAYTKVSRCPPFSLARYIAWLIEAEIDPAFIIAQVLVHLPCENRLEDFHALVRRRWGALHRDRPRETSRLWKRALKPWESVAHGGETWRSTDPSDPEASQAKTAARAAAASLRPGQRAERFLQSELAGGREAPATDVERRAAKEGIAARTLDRARHRLRIVSRRRAGRFWLSMPRVPKSA